MTTAPAYVKDLETNTVFDKCRGDNHSECQAYFCIPYQNGGMYESYCKCDCHQNKQESLPLEDPYPIENSSGEDEWEVDYVSVQSREQMETLAEEAEEVFGFDKMTFLAACWVAEKALNVDGNNSYPFWKAYEEAKSQVIDGSQGVITLCTGTITDGKCVVCGGTPAIKFSDTLSDLQIHLLEAYYE